ncbi:MAG: type II secretion system major pseudopilin GspG [Gammaproteobacteria bacterium]|jgi:general secretion pathway protein G|nr:type II secretion system major pseudopilin GspG [Gammaproteobacteria bacterium]
MITRQAPRCGVQAELVPVVSVAGRSVTGSVARVAHVGGRVGAGAGRRAGFTLLELLVVLVIIGLLAGYVGPQFFKQIGKSESKTATAQVDALSKALDQYRLDTGRYPSTEQGLGALWVQPAGETRWWGPYLRKAPPKDPWGRDYGYRAPGEHGEYDLFSLGKDGREGGGGEDQDITSW